MHRTVSMHARLIAALFFTFGVQAASAHTGHDTSGLAEGLTHPFGLDHLLAMVAVGVWSVCALPGRRSLAGPAVFMGALIAGAAAGVSGLTVSGLEWLIAASVVLFGVMLFLARSALSAAIGLAVVAAAGALHGLAHGAEAPGAGVIGYAAGFLVTTALLHAGGAAGALAVRRCWPLRSAAVVSAIGVIFGGAGMYLLTQA